MIIELPPAVATYFASVMNHDWDALRTCLADDFERLGPYPEHIFPEPDGYVAFLAELLPTIADHTLTVDRALTAGDRCYVEITEGFSADASPAVSHLCLAFDLAPDGRLRHLTAYLRRTL